MSNTTKPADTTMGPAPSRLATVMGENVAVVGQPMGGTSAVVTETLERAAGRGRDTLLISAARGPARLRVPDEVSVIDCTPGETPRVDVSVNSPADLTGISMPLSRFLDDADDPVVAVDSITSLLQYTGEKEVFRFLSVLGGQVSAADGLGLFTVNDGAHEEKTVRTFAQLFDGQVRVRNAPGGAEARADGVGTFPTGWVPAGR